MAIKGMNQIIRVGADVSGLIGGFKKAGGTVGGFAKKASDSLNQSALSAENLKKAMAQGSQNTYIVSLTDQIRELEQEQKALKAAGFGWGFEGFEQNESLLRSLKNELNDYIKSIQKADDKTEDLEESTKDTFSSVKTKAADASVSISGFTRAIRRLGIVSMGLRLVRGLFGRLSSLVRQYVSENDVLEAQVNALKNGLGQALAPAINLVTNALSKLMPYIIGVSNAISSLITSLFGAGWTSFAAGANSAAKAAGGAGAAIKRSLYGFDEITKLDEKSGGGGGAASSDIAAIEGALPGWVTSWAELIKQSIASGNWEIVGETLAEKLSQVIGDLDLTVLMEKLPSLQSGLTTFFKGWFSGISWESIGDFLKTNIEGFFQSFDLGSVFQSGIKSAFAGNPIAQAMVDGLFGNIKEYFAPYIAALSGEYETVGEEIMVGVLMGIADAVLNVGKWIKEYVFDPLVEGFKKVFDIHSPAAHPEIRSIGKNIILGVLEGILEIAKSPLEWIKTNVFTPIQQAMQNLFDGTVMAKFTVGVKNTASRWWQDVKSWWGQKVSQPVQSFTTNVRNDANIWWQNVKSWWSGEIDELQPFQVKVNNDAAVWWQNVVGWWNETIGAVTFGAELRNNATTWWNNLKQWWGETIGTASFGAALRNNAATWWNDLKKWWNETIGELELKIKLPRIEVEWGQLSALGQTFNYPKSFKLQWNAHGAILNGAQLFGMVGNTLLGGGEAGREAVLPLDRHTGWMDDIADRVAARMGNSGGAEQQITVNVPLDGKILASTVVRVINGQARATGHNPLSAYI